MKKTLLLAAFLSAVLFLALGGIHYFFGSSRSSAPVWEPPADPGPGRGEGFLHGRVTTPDGETYEGRLRWGGHEEAFWNDAFNGRKSENPWASHVPAEKLRERRPMKVFGKTVASWDRPVELARPFRASFGDLRQIEVDGPHLRVTWKNGSVVELDRFSYDDIADGLRVWDARGVVDLGERQIRKVDLFPAEDSLAVPERLYGTVTTERSTFTGFLQWNRKSGLGTDLLGETEIPFSSVASFLKGTDNGPKAVLRDGQALSFEEKPRGVYVDDPRYGRVLVSWEAFVRLDFAEAPGGGPAYGDFPPGEPLVGTVVTHGGRRLAGRLVYDLDESETPETLDAPLAGVNYALPFGRVASIELPSRDGQGRVTLRGGEVLRLEAAGDLDPGNAGMLIFRDGEDGPAYVRWSEVSRIDLDPSTGRRP